MGGLLCGDLKPEKLWPGAHQVQLKTGVDPSVRRSGSVRTSTESPLWTQKTERCWLTVGGPSTEQPSPPLITSQWGCRWGTFSTLTELLDTSTLKDTWVARVPQTGEKRLRGKTKTEQSYVEETETVEAEKKTRQLFKKLSTVTSSDKKWVRDLIKKILGKKRDDLIGNWKYDYRYKEPNKS